MALAKEINENTAIVNEAVNAKKRMVAAEKKAAQEQEKTQTVRMEKKNIYNLRYQRQQSSQLRQHIADLGDVDQLREEHESLWLEFDELRLNYDNLHAELEEKNAEIDQVRDAEQSTMANTRQLFERSFTTYSALTSPTTKSTMSFKTSSLSSEKKPPVYPR